MVRYSTHNLRTYRRRRIAYFSFTECIAAFSLASLAILIVVVAPARIIYYAVLEAKGECSYGLSVMKRHTPVTALVGPPGCGTHWLHYVIEQISGYHVGSIYDRTGASVIAVESNYLKLIGPVDRAIVIYRTPLDCSRVSFDSINAAPRRLVATRAQYVNRDMWERHVSLNVKNWENLYTRYLTFDGPMLIINYEDLADNIYGEMYRLVKFLQLPVRNSIFNCVAKSPVSIRFKRTPIKLSFDPSSLIHPRITKRIRSVDTAIKELLNRRRQQEQLRELAVDNRTMVYNTVT